MTSSQIHVEYPRASEGKPVSGAQLDVVDLVARICSAADLAAACHLLANDAVRPIGCRQCAVGLRRRGRGAVRLKALSSASKFGPQAQLTLAIEAAMNESILRGRVSAFPPTDDSDRHGLLVHQSLTQLAGVPAAVSVPLVDKARNAWGVLLLLADQPISEGQIESLDQWQTPVGSALALLDRAEPGPLGRWIRHWNPRQQRGRVALLVVLIAAAAMAIPVPHNVHGDCEIQPVTRRYVAAPFDGTLEKTLVDPGDVVKQGEVLARMDEREIRLEVDGIIAEKQRAQRKQTASLAGGQVADAQLAKFEVERLEIKERLLQQRLGKLQITSPIEGVLIVGDLKRAEGVRLSVGQSLFEVAPLAEMIAEIAVPESEIAFVAAGQIATIELDAYPGRHWSLELSRLHPRAEIRRFSNVFLAEARLTNAEQLLRPGMRGQARIRVGARALGWILFHRASNQLQRWLGW